MKNFKFILPVFLLLSAPLIQADSLQDPLLESNQAYEQGEFDKAHDGYLSLVQQGFESPSLYYNLGNASYKKGERGDAVLWYERALRLAPRDPDILFNLSLARSHLKDEEADVFQKIIFYFTDKELAFFTLLLCWIFFVVLGLEFIKGPEIETWSIPILWTTGIFLVLGGTWFGARLMAAHKPWAIVVSPPGEVRNGPGLEYAVGFTIPEGSKVVILDRRPEWSQVGVPQQGLKGWMPAKDVTPVIS